MHNLASELRADDLPDGMFDGEDDAEAFAIMQNLATAIEYARTRLENAAKALLDQSAALKSDVAASAWQAKTNQAKEAYGKLKSDLQTQGVSDPSEYGRLVQERQRLDGEVKRFDGLQKQLDELKQLVGAQLEQVLQARRGISGHRATFLEETLIDNRFVQMRLIMYSRDKMAIEHALRDVLGAQDNFKEDIYVTNPDRGLIADLFAQDDLIGASNATEFEGYIETLKNRLISACRGKGDFGARFNKYLVAEAGKHPELVDCIDCWFPEDGLEVEYSRNGDGKDFQPIGQASAGQRAAAMLAFLLAHGDEPLILDQPEDDLDNHLIYDLVVQQIRANKQRRQLIIVTHNPNIVVNGDAEMIHALDFNHQCFVKLAGSLQDQDMRDEICKVMEGGKTAFERRYQRLGREI